MQKANIILCGKTGVGKSTLINSIFGSIVAKEGIGECITKEVNEYSGNSVNTSLEFCLYDTEGFELDFKQREQSISDVKKIIRECLEKKPDNFIHAIWYCINVMNSRVEDKEYNIVMEIAKEFNIQVFIVLTQAINMKRTELLMESINKDSTAQIMIQERKIAGIIPVLAKRYQIIDTQYIEPFGLDTLETKTSEVVEEAVKNAYIKKIDLMKKKAEKYSAGYITTSIASGASPIPFSDAAILIPVQVAMLVHINSIFEINIGENVLKKIAEMVISIGGATLIGKTVVSNVLKFIPGIGTVMGGAISASVAGTITTALSRAYINQAKQYKIEQFYNVNNDENSFIDTVVANTSTQL